MADMTETSGREDTGKVDKDEEEQEEKESVAPYSILIELIDSTAIHVSRGQEIRHSGLRRRDIC